MHSNSVCNHTSDNKTDCPTCLSRVRLRTKFLLPISHKNYSFREKKKRESNVALKERKKDRKKERSLYTVSMMIETKVVIG